MTISWWVLGTADKKQFVGWSCGEPGPLEDAAVYRTEDNAQKKLKGLRKYDASAGTSYYTNFIPMEIKVTL